MSSINNRLTIGFFDSGIGGLSVWYKTRQRLPDCASLYVADNAHCPYGSRQASQVRDFSRSITRFLLDQGADLIVVACNTASAAALENLRAEFDVPIVGMEPAVKPAAEHTQTGHVGVLATCGTVNGELFKNTSARYAAGVELHVQIGVGLVERVEAGQIQHPDTENLLRKYLQPMIDAGVDQIVLGCTHYAFLLPLIQRIVPEGVTVIDPGTAVARQVERVLRASRPQPILSHQGVDLAAASELFFATGTPEILAETVLSQTGQTQQVKRICWHNGTLRDK